MDSTQTINPKCSHCKCYFIPTVKSSGLTYKTCEKCRTKGKESKIKNKCEHAREKSRCKECKGSGICIHDKVKSSCKECKGSQICIHDKIKSQCKECGGGSICIHDKQKSKCKECGGGSFCIHDKQKSVCKECGGGSICIHDREKRGCKICNFKLYLIKLQRGQINRCFKNSKNTKTKHSIEYLGCDIETLINIFEKKIEYFNTYLASDVTMTWDNIHIDHIKPVSKFDLDDEGQFLDCCHYTNLQPLLITDNLEKSNKWNDENNKYWNENIKDKEYFEIYF